MRQHVIIVAAEQSNHRLLSSIASEIRNVIVTRSRHLVRRWRGVGKAVDCLVLHMSSRIALEAVQQIRARDILVPIVIVTAAHQREVRSLALDLGVNDFIQEPIDHQESRARLSTILALRAAQRQAALQIQ